MIFFRFFLWALIVFSSVSCARFHRPSTVQYAFYRVSDSVPVDMTLKRMLQPFSDSVSASMNEVIAEVGTMLLKKQPEGTLGNLMTDALLAKAREKYRKTVHAAFVNHGGVRLNELPPGPLTKGRVFEMMPFDNLLLLQTMRGDTLQQYIDVMASYGGWPVSGISYEIRNRRAENIRIGELPLDPAEYYTIANSDYIVNGGDRMPIVPAVVENKGLLMRELLMEYFSELRAKGIVISSSIENRVIHAK